MAATPKPIRKKVKKLASESRRSSVKQQKGIKKSTQKMLTKKAKEEKRSKKSISFIKSQY